MSIAGNEDIRKNDYRICKGEWNKPSDIKGLDAYRNTHGKFINVNTVSEKENSIIEKEDIRVNILSEIEKRNRLLLKILKSYFNFELLIISIISYNGFIKKKLINHIYI